MTDGVVETRSETSRGGCMRVQVQDGWTGVFGLYGGERLWRSLIEDLLAVDA